MWRPAIGQGIFEKGAIPKLIALFSNGGSGESVQMYRLNDSQEPLLLTYTKYIWASTRENLSSGVCEQHRRRPACASTQSDQCLCYSLFGKYQM